MQAQKRDKNEASIVDALSGIGANVKLMDKDEGHDLLVAFRGVVYVAEIKNPEWRWKLTPAEKKRKEDLEAVGVTYHILTTIEEALQMVGAV